jgi:predicted transcriptional regulator
VRLGLLARTRILQVLEKGESDVKGTVKSTGLTYNVIIHHLRLLEAERVVVRRGNKRPFVWQLTGAGQQRLNYLAEK